MSNDLLVFANEIKKAANELTKEVEAAAKPPVLDDDKQKNRLNKELQTYATFLRKFLSVKGNDEIFSKLTPLFNNPRLRKPRNSILLMLEKGEQTSQTKEIAELIMDLRRIMLRYGSLADRYPAIKLLKEILNYGVVSGVPAFKRLLTIKRRLYNTFGAQGALEKQKQKELKNEEQTQKP